jgi:ferredoxin
MRKCIFLLCSLAVSVVSSAGAFSFIPSPTRQPCYSAGMRHDRTSNTITSIHAQQNNVNDLSLETISDEWTANLVAKTDIRDEGVYLGVKDSRKLFVDTLKVTFPRGDGLGIELLELAGGREDGLGITVVSGLVHGGSAQGTDMRPGDSLTKVAIVSMISSDGDVEEQLSVGTECLGFDATVDAIRSLPPSNSSDEFFCLTIKRLRRKPQVTIRVQYPPSQKEADTSIQLWSGENLRQGLLIRGIRLNDALARRHDNGLPGDCGAEGMCLTCSVSVIQGGDLLNPQGMTEQQLLIDNPRWRLACKAQVGFGMKEGDITIRVNPRQWVQY